jgi:hypothetical protein
MTFNYFKDEYLLIKKDLMLNLLKMEKKLIIKPKKGYDNIVYNSICNEINGLIRKIEMHNSDMKELLVKAETIPYDEAMIKIFNNVMLAEAEIRLIAKRLMDNNFKDFINTNYQLVVEFGNIGERHSKLGYNFASSLGLEDSFVNAIKD